MAKHAGGELRSRSDFYRTMRNDLYLQSIAAAARKRLFVDLYTLASFKIAFATGSILVATKIAPRARAKRKRSQEAAALLRAALEAVQKARARCEDALSTCEELAPQWKVRRFTFAEIEKDLTFSVGFLKAAVRLQAAVIPPELRTAAEKRLAAEHMLAFDAIADGASTLNFPVTKKLRRFDTWFIHKAAECIGRYKPPKRGELSRLEMTIARLFEAAFGTTRTEASIHKVLKRGQISRTPDCKPGQKDYVFKREKFFSPNQQFLEEETRRSKLGYPRG